MAESSTPVQSGALPILGVAGERAGKPVADALRNANRAAIENALGKQESWVRKVINGECGVMLDDIDALLDALDKKAVSKGKMCIDPELARAYEHIVKASTANRSLLFEDSE